MSILNIEGFLSTYNHPSPARPYLGQECDQCGQGRSWHAWHRSAKPTHWNSGLDFTFLLLAQLLLVTGFQPPHAPNFSEDKIGDKSHILYYTVLCTLFTMTMILFIIYITE